MNAANVCKYCIECFCAWSVICMFFPSRNRRRVEWNDESSDQSERRRRNKFNIQTNTHTYLHIRKGEWTSSQYSCAMVFLPLRRDGSTRFLVRWFDSKNLPPTHSSSSIHSIQSTTIVAISILYNILIILRVRWLELIANLFDRFWSLLDSTVLPIVTVNTAMGVTWDYQSTAWSDQKTNAQTEGLWTRLAHVTICCMCIVISL